MSIISPWCCRNDNRTCAFSHFGVVSLSLSTYVSLLPKGLGRDDTNTPFLKLYFRHLFPPSPSNFFNIETLDRLGLFLATNPCFDTLHTKIHRRLSKGVSPLPQWLTYTRNSDLRNFAKTGRFPNVSFSLRRNFVSGKLDAFSIYKAQRAVIKKSCVVKHISVVLHQGKRSDKLFFVSRV